MILAVMASAYTGLLVVLRVVVLGGRAVWNHMRGSNSGVLGPIHPWELYIGPCLLIANLAFVLFGYKDVLLPGPTRLTSLVWPVQLIVVVLLLGVMLLVFRRVPFSRRFLEALSTQRQASLLLIPVALTLLPPDTARTHPVAAALPARLAAAFPARSRCRRAERRRCD